MVYVKNITSRIFVMKLKKIIMDTLFSIYRRRDNGHIINTKDVFLDNRWVVPHNVNLVIKYNAHINVEICSSILSIKYLYKYVYKGHDRATITLFQSDHNNSQQI